MAHVTIEWTQNLDGLFDRQRLMTVIAQAMAERSNGIFPLAGIRVRSMRLDEYVIADGRGEDDGFVNVRVLMGVGRSPAFRQQFFDELFATITAQLADLVSSRPTAISMYVDEAEGWKMNTIRLRLEEGTA